MYQKYYRPAKLDEALTVLAEGAGSARVMAGGTDLMIQLHKGDITFDTAVDISAIRELRYIDEENGRIKIGALATHTDLAQSSLLRQKAPLLAEAAGSVGSLQIRNVGTVGGNVVNAQPAADTAVPLMALNAEATVVSPTGKRKLPIGELYDGAGGTTLDPAAEILTEFSFRIPGNEGASGAFSRVSKRKALCLPVFNAAVVIIPASGGSGIKDVRIVMAPVARLPLRAKAGEQYLLSTPPGADAFRAASEIASAEAKPRDSVFRGSSGYRKELAKVIVFRTLLKAWNEIAS